MVDFHRHKADTELSNIPDKANRLLYLLFLLIFLIILRVWHLSYIQHDKKLGEALQARKKVLVEAPRRGTIRDRFNNLLAINTTDYRASFVFAEIREVPNSILENGKRRFLRKEYIQALSIRVGAILNMDAARLEDLIYSHAALYDTLPYVFKRSISEEQYYKLKVLEKEFLGLHVDAVAQRKYPRGKVASHVIGYLGAMPQSRYDALVMEIRSLQNQIMLADVEDDVELLQMKLLELTERAYTMNDSVGISGVENSFEEELRGYAGKQVFFSDAKGNFIRELQPSRDQVSGKRLLITLSADLQEFCEKLLGQYELDRERIFKKENTEHAEPWIRGGAIVAIEPNSGEVVALASFPRFDPNDFVTSGSSEKVSRWVENESYQAMVWDGRLPIQREVCRDAVRNEWATEELPLTWNDFLNLVLLPSSPLFKPLSERTPIRDMIVLQRSFDALLKLSPDSSPQEVLEMLEAGAADEVKPYRDLLMRWFSTIPDRKERLLLLDLSRLILSHEDFSRELVEAIGHLSVADFRKLASRFAEAEETCRKETRESFHIGEFQEWRKQNEKAFLKERRLREKENKRQTKPFLDYIDRQERELFSAYYRAHRLELLHAALFEEEKPFYTIDPSLSYEFLNCLKGFHDLEKPLYGRYRGVHGKDLKALASSYLRALGTSYLRSFAFRETTIQGSIFKLVTAYAGLKQRYNELKGQVAKADLRLFEIFDNTFKSEGKTYVGRFLDGKAIPQLYKGGRVPKSLHHDLGKLDLVKAIETSSNPYFSLLAGDFLKDPNLLAQAAHDFGYGEKTGVRLPLEIRGNVPHDLATNKTGLYATAIGQHTLITTPLQTSLMLSCIANGGKLLEPQIAHLVAGKALLTPLVAQPRVVPLPFQVRRTLFMPGEIRATLLEGMRGSVNRALKDQGALPRLYAQHPDMKQAFQKVGPQLVGKTSTAEVLERVGLSPLSMYRHIWFGGISFKEDAPHFGKPELVVVVYLRFGGYGKEAAPIAAQVVQKWRDLNAKAESNGG